MGHSLHFLNFRLKTVCINLRCMQLSELKLLFLKFIQTVFLENFVCCFRVGNVVCKLLLERFFCFRKSNPIISAHDITHCMYITHIMHLAFQPATKLFIASLLRLSGYKTARTEIILQVCQLSC